VVDHATKPRNLGTMEKADGFARRTGTCGDTMELWLNVRDGVIGQIAFMTDGCGTTLATGSMVTEMARGKKPGVAFKISEQDILTALGGLPPENEHCAALAADTLKAAISSYLKVKNEPWKNLYGKH